MRCIVNKCTVFCIFGTRMKTTTILSAQTVIQLCKAKQIQHIVISPGSRNAPLTIAFTHDSFFTCYSIVDERSAAFFALGIAQQTKVPTVLVCTSGSAVLNYYPAIAEAYYSNIPLVVVSADRPEYLINRGDGQTINQYKIFTKHIIYETQLKLDCAEDKAQQNAVQNYNEIELNKALNAAIINQGPVHINIPLKEPLYETVSEYKVIPKVEVLETTKKQLSNANLEQAIEQWNTATRKMVLIGVQKPNTIAQRWLDIFAADESVIVLTETTSNIHHKHFFSKIDTLITPLNESEFKDLQPNILVTFGGMLVSKRIKAFLRNFKPKQHWHVGVEKANDTFFSLTQHFQQKPNLFLEAFLPATKLRSSFYFNYWNTINNQRTKAQAKYMENCEFSDLKIFPKLLQALPKNSTLQLANSTVIRYSQLFSINPSIEVYCNRGTSGIDGSTSTAIGAAIGNPKPTTLVTGDLSFFYDSNALWNNYIPKNFRILLINNQGGGIFRILPGDSNSPKFETYIETTNTLSAKQLCEMHKIEYYTTNNLEELNNLLSNFFTISEAPRLLEIVTPRTKNDEVLKKYFESL